MSNNKWTPWKVKGHPPSFRSATRSKWCGNMVVEDLETIKSQSGRFFYSGQNWYICLLFFMFYCLLVSVHQPLFPSPSEVSEIRGKKESLHTHWLGQYTGTQRFSHSRTSMRRRGEMPENLWVPTLGPLDVLIQSEAVCEVSESNSNSETSITAFDWISTFKGPNMCAQRFSHIRLITSSPHTRLWARKPLGFRGLWQFKFKQPHHMTAFIRLV